jgi:hypothetical protein
MLKLSQAIAGWTAMMHFAMITGRQLCALLFVCTCLPYAQLCAQEGAAVRAVRARHRAGLASASPAYPFAYSARPRWYSFGYYLGGYRYPFAYPYYRYNLWRFPPQALLPGSNDQPDGPPPEAPQEDALPLIGPPPPPPDNWELPPPFGPHGPDGAWSAATWQFPGWHYAPWYRGWWWVLPGGFWLTPPVEYFNPDELDLDEPPAFEVRRNAREPGPRVFGPYRAIR